MRVNSRKDKIRKFMRSKYLMRRLIIIGVGLILIYILISGLLKGLFPSKDSNTKYPLGETEASEINSQESTDQSEINSESTEITNDQSDGQLTTETQESTSIGSETQEQPNTNETKSDTQGENIMSFNSVAYSLSSYDARYTAYSKAHPELTAEQVVLRVNTNLDQEFYTNITEAIDPNSIEVLCNKFYQLSSSFEPSELVSVKDGYYVQDGKSYLLSQSALSAFIEMSDAAKKEGVSIKIISAYRTYSYQENLYNKYTANNGKAAADRFSARPGHSEHETGFAIDINDVAQAFENTEAFQWLSKNSYKYGYILRYPKGKEDTTGYMYEPWHYRYLGADLATKVQESDLTYDEYYAKYLLKDHVD
ncbi:MAG: hypothetical protein BGO41_12605 [Clostridiales bacterium 38-18]|nr:MAG: hypothetical protein BGO41_12605 [Clostridiales bacterium 38-18]